MSTKSPQRWRNGPKASRCATDAALASPAARPSRPSPREVGAQCPQIGDFDNFMNIICSGECEFNVNLGTSQKMVNNTRCLFCLFYSEEHKINAILRLLNSPIPLGSIQFPHCWPGNTLVWISSIYSSIKYSFINELPGTSLTFGCTRRNASSNPASDNNFVAGHSKVQFPCKCLNAFLI